MKNLTRFTIALIVLLITSSAFAVTAERGNFITIGRTSLNENGEEELADERVFLSAGPGVDAVQAELKSGTVVQVLQKVPLETGNFYNVSTVGESGGIMGWVSEEYIYEIIIDPQIE